MPVPSVRLPALENDWVAVAVLGCVVLVAPILGFFLCLLAAFDRSRANVRPVLLALAGCALALMVVPGVRYGVWQLLT